MLRIVYFGSSDFSLPGLRACLDASNFEVVGVVTTPPKKQGRGLELMATVVAQFCAKKSIRYFDFLKLEDIALKQISELKPDIFVVASYGKIIPESFLNLANLRFNIHPSLLPKYRGASPINGPILNADTKTGLSIADVTKALDAGDIYYQEEVPLLPSADSEAMEILLAEKSYGAMRQLLDQARDLKVSGRPQNHEDSSYAPKLKKEDGRLSFSDPSNRWDRIVRGLKPWPGAFIEINGERIGIISICIKGGEPSTKIGCVREISENGLIIQTSIGCVEWLQVRPAGKNAMTGAAYARGKRLKSGDRLQ